MLSRHINNMNKGDELCFFDSMSSFLMSQYVPLYIHVYYGQKGFRFVQGFT